MAEILSPTCKTFSPKIVIHIKFLNALPHLELISSSFTPMLYKVHTVLRLLSFKVFGK